MIICDHCRQPDTEGCIEPNQVQVNTGTITTQAAAPIDLCDGCRKLLVTKLQNFVSEFRNPAQRAR